MLVACGCATAPVRDTDAERIDTAMVAEQGEPPPALPMGEAPALAPTDETVPGQPAGPRGRLYRHLTRGQTDFYTGNVTVPNVTTAGPALPPAP